MAKDSDKVVKVIIKRGNTALFMQKDTGEWELPGGHIHVGEKYKHGAKREVLEETGILISKLRLILTTKNFKLFAAMPKVSRVVLSDEHIGFMWATSQQAKRLNHTSATKINLRYILNSI